MSIYLMLFEQESFWQTLINLIDFYQVLFDQSMFDSAMFGQMLFDQMSLDQTSLDQTSLDQTSRAGLQFFSWRATISLLCRMFENTNLRHDVDVVFK